LYLFNLLNGPNLSIEVVAILYHQEVHIIHREELANIFVFFELPLFFIEFGILLLGRLDHFHRYIELLSNKKLVLLRLFDPAVDRTKLFILLQNWNAHP
jgi:hypothetical protein